MTGVGITRGGRWRARAWRGGVTYSLGTFPTEAEARAAVDAAVLDDMDGAYGGTASPWDGDTYLYAQATRESRAEASPTRRLMIALLESAIAEANTPESREWFAGLRGAPGFGFEEVCTELGLEPAVVLERIASREAA